MQARDDQSPAAQMIDLLTAFDAVRGFVGALWEADGSRSNDIATFLGNMNRNAVINNAPLDAAQWSDWLDAVLAVRPDLTEVMEARRRFQKDWEEFQRLQRLPMSRQKAAMDDLRIRLAMRTWHIIGHHQLSARDAYAAFKAFAIAYWTRGNRASFDVGKLVNALGDAENPPDPQWQTWLSMIQWAKANAAGPSRKQ